MPPHQQHHPVILHDSALYVALRRKGSRRNEVPKEDCYVTSPTTQIKNRIRPLGPGAMILLDEIGLQEALKVKSQQRRAAHESNDQSQTSVDRRIESPKVSRKEILKLKLANLVALHEKRKCRIRDLGRAEQHTVIPNNEPQNIIVKEPGGPSRTNTQGKISTPQQPKIIKRRVLQKETKTTGAGIGAGEDSEQEAPENQAPRQPHLPANRPSEKVAPVSVSSVSQKGLKPAVTRSSKTPPSESARPVTGTSHGSSEYATPPVPREARTTTVSSKEGASTKEATTKEATNDRGIISQVVGARGSMKTPSKGIVISKSPRPDKDVNASVPAENKPRELASNSNHSILNSSSNHSTPINVSTESTGSGQSYLDPSSLGNKPPVSWSLRNQNKTGFVPNQYITTETMAHYTEALGGVETVAKTTRIFYFSAKQDPSLQIFFEDIQWENIRNEFIILANLATPTKYDETIKGGLQYHCHLLENGADIERVITLWESAIESSWLENRMDDARQLIVGPSRVLFNLRAIERHYAMYLMAQRAAARASRRSTKDEKDKVSAGENPSVARRRRPGMFGRFRGRR